ncbi:ABC transporter ATP-binding protein/permease [Patescibacteria group bacterium]|nr:ABC transporter ATP-binding protein/permease [Patescibacteria group bacterium]
MRNKEEENKKGRNPILNVLATEWKFLGNQKKIFLFYMSFFVISSCLGLLVPLVIGNIFNSIQTTIVSSQEVRRLIFLIFLLLGVEIVFWMFHAPARIFEQLTGFNVHRNYTNDKISKILELPVKWHKDNHSGDTIDKINRGRSSIDTFSQDYTSKLVYIFIKIFVSLGILFFVDAKIASFALVSSSIVLIGVMNVDKYLRRYYKELNKFSNKLGASVFDYLSNIITIITLRLKKTVSKEIDYRLVASYPTHKKVVIVDELKWSFGSITITLMTVLVLAYKSYSDYNTSGIILIGTLYILYSYLERVGDAFFQFGELYGDIVKRSARIEGAYSIDEEFEKIKEKINGQLPSDWKEVEVKGLNFTYDEAWKKNHLQNVNMKFRRGQKIALVGESGSGKSTVLAIMRGLYPPQNGEIYCDGEKLKNGFEKLKRNVTLIPQEPEIFNETIKYNITMDLPTRKDDLDKVIEMAQFIKVVEKLDKGINTNVMEKGVSLSGGEKQRLALARGLLAAKNSDIVLLDEPTSSVDSLNEMKIHDSIFRNFKGKTIISSIHRLHLLGKFDYVYLFDKGKIIAEGTLEELKKNYKFRYLLKKYGMKKEVK